MREQRFRPKRVKARENPAWAGWRQSERGTAVHTLWGKYSLFRRVRFPAPEHPENPVQERW